VLDNDSGVVRRHDSLGFSVFLFSTVILFMPSDFFHYCAS
jgi:predicted membrane channel-forming protein YqfA (hemolysin III family)